MLLLLRQIRSPGWGAHAPLRHAGGPYTGFRLEKATRFDGEHSLRRPVAWIMLPRKSRHGTHKGAHLSRKPSATRERVPRLIGSRPS
jgi:hypothetical protein